MFRHPKTLQEARLNDDPEWGHLARARRKYPQLPNAWDDLPESRPGRTWKAHRRTPYKGNHELPAAVVGGKGSCGLYCPRARRPADHHQPFTRKDSRRYAEHRARVKPVGRCPRNWYRSWEQGGKPLSYYRRCQTHTEPRLAYTWDTCEDRMIPTVF